MKEYLNPENPRKAEPNSRKNIWWAKSKYFLFLILLIIAALFGVLLNNLFFPGAEPLSQNDVDESIVSAMASATPELPFSTLVYQSVLPSIVYIQTRQKDAAEEDGYGVGSGVVVNADGDVLTAYHVVEDAEKIDLHFADGSQSTAEIISAEPENDIAVLHPERLPDLIVPATLGNSGTMRVGDEAFAIGNPMGLSASMSAGVISGFNRSIPINDDLRLEGLIQFDTAVNPGNSGGPLLNRNGQVIGIVTALANPSEQPFFVGIGFAVPIGTAVAAAGGPNY